MKKSLLILPGDGIGPEVMRQVARVIDWFGRNRMMQFEISQDLLGGCAYDAHGAPISDATVARAKASDAVLVGAVGAPAYDDLPFAQRPEQGLLRLRKDLDLFANLRPAFCFDAMIDQSTLKPDVLRGLDLMIVRELTSGLYFGEPRGIEIDAQGQEVGVNTQRYTVAEITRVARFAFELARSRNGRVCSMEKANVLESGALWRRVVGDIHAAEYADIDLSHMYADNGGMQLVRNPRQFDVIVTDNLFGDILSDVAAMLTGSLGMLPSASLGTGKTGLYEPVHGSAPDIAGQNLANPIAAILSFAMALKHSLDAPDEALRLERAVAEVLSDGVLTDDLRRDAHAPVVTTTEMGDAILQKLTDLLGDT